LRDPGRVSTERSWPNSCHEWTAPGDPGLRRGSGGGGGSFGWARGKGRWTWRSFGSTRRGRSSPALAPLVAFPLVGGRADDAGRCRARWSRGIAGDTVRRAGAHRFLTFEGPRAAGGDGRDALAAICHRVQLVPVGSSPSSASLLLLVFGVLTMAGGCRPQAARTGGGWVGLVGYGAVAALLPRRRPRAGAVMVPGGG